MFVALILFFLFPRVVFAGCTGTFDCGAWVQESGYPCYGQCFLPGCCYCNGTENHTCGYGGTSCAPDCNSCVMPGTNSCSCTPSCTCAQYYCPSDTCSNGCGGTCTGTKGTTPGVWGSCGSDCVRSCTKGQCGGACPGTPASCAVNGTWSTLTCDGKDLCGQTLTATCEDASCGGTCTGNGGVAPTLTCPNTDDGIPDVPTCTDKVNIQGTLPVRVTWTTGGVLTDKYEYRFDVGATDNTKNLYANWNADVGGTHSWQARAVNTSCGTDRSNFSNRCYFCYEKGNCLPACGQPSYCSDSGFCPTTDVGKPPAPIFVNPAGSATNPVNKLPGPVTLKWTPAVTDTLTDTWRIVLTKLSNGTTITYTGIDVGTSKQVVDGLATGKVYSWEVWGINNSCDPKIWGDRAIGYFVLNSPPEVTALKLENCVGTNVPHESGRNHICQDAFRECANPRQVTFKAQVSDPEGWVNISGGTLAWNGWNYNMTKLSGAGLDGTMAVTVDFTESENNRGVFPLAVTVRDIFGETASDTFRSWKVWDCLVSVSGTLFESATSGGKCNPVHYTNPAGGSLGFSALIYKDLYKTFDKEMNVSLPADYSGLTDDKKLIWGNDYLPVFNDGSISNPNGTTLNGSLRKTRVIDLGTGTTFCPTTFSFNLGVATTVSAYVNNPRAQVDFSFSILPGGWFQVVGGGIKAKANLSSGVPVTAPDESEALSLAGAESDNGLITYGGSYTNTSGNDTSPLGKPNNWYKNINNNNSTKYSYQYFYNSFLVKAGIGVVVTNWSEISSHTVDGGIFFVNGNLTIDSDFVLNSGKTMMVIVKGDMVINNNVKRIDGIYISDGEISASGSSPNQLVINGSVYSLSSVSFTRSYTDASLNITTPAVKVNYQSSYMFNMPGILMRGLSGWREE